uniref:Uncharacterized protein n=1 Tax=Kalanchoe fedtschenkoi TaxID=63787 RepID=A0A7N0T4Q9_KALFE
MGLRIRGSSFRTFEFFRDLQVLQGLLEEPRISECGQLGSRGGLLGSLFLMRRRSVE